MRLARVAHPVERRRRLRARGGGGRAAGAALGLAVVPGRHGVLLRPEAAAGGSRGPFRTGVGRALAVCLVVPRMPLAHETQVDVLFAEVDRAQQAAVAVARLALYLHAAVQDALREVLPRLRAALLPQFRRVDADEPHLLLPPLGGDGDRVAVRHAQAAAFRRAECLRAEEEQEKEENEFCAKNVPVSVCFVCCHLVAILGVGECGVKRNVPKSVYIRVYDPRGGKSGDLGMGGRGGCSPRSAGRLRVGAGGASVLLEAVAGVFGGAGGVAAEEVFKRAAEGSGEEQHLRIHHAALAVLYFEDGLSHDVPPQKLAGSGEILLRPLPGAAQFFDGGAHDVDFLCCGHVMVSVQP